MAPINVNVNVTQDKKRAKAELTYDYNKLLNIPTLNEDQIKGNITIDFKLLSPGDQPSVEWVDGKKLLIGIPQNIIYVTQAEYEELKRRGAIDPNAYYAIGEADKE